MLVGTCQKLSVVPSLKIRLNDAEISSVTTYNYLGVQFDSELSLGYHLTEVHARVQRKHFHLRKIHKFLNEYTALQVFK